MICLRVLSRSGNAKSYAYKAGLALTAPLLLLLLEAVAYCWEQDHARGQYAWELVASRRLDLDVYSDPSPGYTLMSPNRKYRWRGVPVEINPQGLRSPTVAFQKPVGRVRILNLGDSVAMGWGIREEQTYGRRVEARLHQAGGDYEVINAAVPGWNLENELAFLKGKGLAYEPDLILLEITVANDIMGLNALQKHRHRDPTVIKWLRAHTYFWPFLTIQFRWLQAKATGRGYPFLEPPASASAYFPLDVESPLWDRTWDLVLQIDDLARARDLPLVLVLFPLEFQVLDPAFSTLAQDLLGARARAAGIPLVDLLKVFRRSCLEKPGGRCERNDGYLFADRWMHPSAYGHELAAQEILRVLVPTGEREDSLLCHSQELPLSF